MFNNQLLSFRKLPGDELFPRPLLEEADSPYTDSGGYPVRCPEPSGSLSLTSPLSMPVDDTGVPTNSSHWSFGRGQTSKANAPLSSPQAKECFQIELGALPVAPKAGLDGSGFQVDGLRRLGSARFSANTLRAVSGNI